ncbi:hypothetical protein ACRUJ1_25240, partial [Burkholderia pseudomallei]
ALDRLPHGPAADALHERARRRLRRARGVAAMGAPRRVSHAARRRSGVARLAGLSPAVRRAIELAMRRSCSRRDGAWRMARNV